MKLILALATLLAAVSAQTEIHSSHFSLAVLTEDVKSLATEDLRDLIFQNGAVLFRHQNISREDQLLLTSRLGTPVVLPPALEGNDPEPGFPEFLRVTSHHADGAWKGNASLGEYWHQDGEFHENRHVINVLYGAEFENISPGTGQTALMDATRFQNYLSKDILQRLQNLKMTSWMGDIADFGDAPEEVFEKYPKVEHEVLGIHPQSGHPFVYLGAETTMIDGWSKEASELFIRETLQALDCPGNVYYHTWRQGDLLLWDNTLVFHRAMPYPKHSNVKRMIFRTQTFVEPNPRPSLPRTKTLNASYAQCCADTPARI